MNTSSHPFISGIVLFFASCLVTGAALTTYIVPSYRSRTQSPFYPGILSGTIYLENFEDRELNTPNVIGFNGGTATDSGRTVDEDDGRLDGYGFSGSGWGVRLRGGSSQFDATQSIHFDFTRDAQGRLPTFAGAAILGFSDLTDIFSTSVLVYDGNGNELTGELIVPIPYFPGEPPSVWGDRFVGFHVPEGISSIWFPRTAIVDHLQYGYAIPEPGPLALLALTAGLTLRRRTW